MIIFPSTIVPWVQLFPKYRRCILDSEEQGIVFLSSSWYTAFDNAGVVEVCSGGIPIQVG